MKTDTTAASSSPDVPLRPIRPVTLASLPRRAVLFAIFTVRFLVELLLANFQIARAVLFTAKAEMRPDFLEYSVRGLRPFEVLVLSHCITLTPGTTTVEVADDFSCLRLHAFDASAPEEVRRSIKLKLEAPLLAWTR